MKTNVIMLGSAFLFITLFSCQEEVPIANSQFPNVDPELWKFYQAFELEANKRGFEYDLNALNISGEIKEISENNVAGSCRFGSHIDNEVTIDKTFWNSSSEIFREFVIFHELGHCVLLRDHDESVDARGHCLSIMRSGLTNCRDTYSNENRATFIDELFYQD